MTIKYFWHCIKCKNQHWTRWKLLIIESMYDYGYSFIGVKLQWWITMIRYRIKLNALSIFPVAIICIQSCLIYNAYYYIVLVLTTMRHRQSADLGQWDNITWKRSNNNQSLDQKLRLYCVSSTCPDIIIICDSIWDYTR